MFQILPQKRIALTVRTGRSGAARTFTLIEMLVVVAIIGILASLLMPTLLRTLGSAHQVACTNNLRQIGTAVSTYTDQFHRYPHGWAIDRWWNKAEPIPTLLGYGNMPDEVYYRSNAPTVLNCPASEFQSTSTGLYYCDYAANKNILRTQGAFCRLPEVKSPSSKVLMFDSYKLNHWSITGGWWCLSTGYDYVNGMDTIWTDRHIGRFDILWADYHVSAKEMGTLDEYQNF